MNLSSESIRHLENKAFLRGIERALEISKQVINRLPEDEVVYGAVLVKDALEKEEEKLSEALEPAQY